MVRRTSLTRLAALGLFFAALLGSSPQVIAQQPLTSAFIYQGELASAGTPVTGIYDIRFRLYDSADRRVQIGPTLCSDNLSVSAGRFAVTLDFGPGSFDGQQRFLEIEVRADAGQDCGDESSFTILTPRQEITSVPHALFAQSAATATSATTAATATFAQSALAATTANTASFAQNATTATNAVSLNGQAPSFYQNAANLTGTLPDARLSTNVARLNGNQTFTGLLNFTNPGNIFTGNGAGLTNLSGASIAAGTLARSSLSAEVQSGVGILGPDFSLLGSVATGDTPASIAVAGSFAYVVNINANTLQVFNISNPASPTPLGSAIAGGFPQDVAVSGSFAYVVNYASDTLQVFNINNPAAPSLVASVAAGISPRSVAVSGSFAYVVSTGGDALLIFNISNPTAPTFAGSVWTGGQPVAVAVSGSFAYVVNQESNTLEVFNVSNPAAPTLAGSVATGTQPLDIAVSGSSVYVVNFSSSTLDIFNVSDPAAPTLVTSIATGSQPNRVTVAGSFAYVLTQDLDPLQVFNISNPAAPTLTRNVATGGLPRSIVVSGSFAYLLVSSADTLQVFNASVGMSFGSPLVASSLAGVSGSGLASLNASNITTGTLADARLSSNIALKNAANAFTSTGVTSFAGNLGIGTTTPSTQFALEAVSGTDTQIALTSGPATGGAIPRRTWSIQSSNVTAPQSQLTGSFQIVDRTVGASRMLIDTNGNVGIGTTTPSQRLTVVGNMNVTGSLAKGGGSFKIDHPLDPENKYLYHSFVESPDMMNIYNGTITTDSRGLAVVELPDYFEALNRDFRYQLTVVDDSENDFILAKVYRKIGVDAPRQFTIKSSMPNIEVSWQVTGIRQDAWAEKNRIPNSVDKPTSEKGTLLHPEAFGKTNSQEASPSTAAGDLEASSK